jgi:amino acid permease
MAVLPCVRHQLDRFNLIFSLTALNSTGTLSLTNGGPAGAIWVFLAVCFGMFTVVLSMAEMASM